MMTAQYQEALHSYAEGRYEEAMRQFSELLYEDPRNPKLHIWLGATFRKAGKIEYAKVQYQQVLTLTDDPDLLDLASTSLAQIQNKLAANSSQRSAPQDDTQLSTTPKAPTAADHQTSDQRHDLKKTQKQGSIPNPNKPLANTSNHTVNTNEETVNLNLLAPSSQPKAPIPKKASAANGTVPPPPAIAALFKNQQPQNDQDHQDKSGVSQKDEPLIEVMIADQDMEEITERATTSVLNDTIANIQEEKKKESQKTKDLRPTKKNKKSKPQVDSPAVESVFLEIDNPNNDYKNHRKSSASKGYTAVSLEDIFKFSSVGQKITLWGALVATIPAIALGLATYHIGDKLLLNKVRQTQQSEATALARVTETFIKQQTSDVEVLQKLLASTEMGENTLQKPVNPNLINQSKPLSSLPIAQQRQYKQLLTNRLNLYSQAYPEYNSIALFDINGELIAQSSKSNTLQTIDPNKLSKAIATDKVLLSNPIFGKGGAHFYAIRALKSSVSQKVSLVLQVEMPVKPLMNGLNNIVSNSDNSGNKSFYLVDSFNKYIASSQSVPIGDDALIDFAMLPDLRSSQSSELRDLVKGDRNVQVLAYAPVLNMQQYDILPWDVLTTIDKATAIAGNQNLLLVVGIGIAATPLLVAAIAYMLSRKLSTRLKDIRAALSDLRHGNLDVSFAALSVEGNDELSDISLSINRMSEQFRTMMQKQEQEKQRLQLQVTKLYKVLSKLAREEKQEIQDSDLSDENILLLGKKVRSEMVQRHAEVESYRHQKEDLQAQLMQMLKDVQTLSDGDLTVSTRSIDGSLTNVAIFFDDVMRGLQNIVTQVKSSANQVNFSLGQNEQAIANLASVSQRQVDTVSRSLTTAQMSKLATSNIINHSEQVVQSSQLVTEKLSDSDRSIDAVMQKVGELQQTVATTAKKIKHLGTVSQKVAKAISAINEIAIKTNFLAINATLEASRTGEVNSGFMLVAEEVGELAARSVAATKEVESLLSNIQSETTAVMAVVESGSNQVSESNTLAIAAKDSLQQIAQISQQIDGLMLSITEATTSQAQTSEGVANLMNDISHMAKRTLASSSEVSKFFKTTRRYSGELQQSLTNFKTR